jgi:tetratricopeptide (TPR) repeat protein
MKNKRLIRMSLALLAFCVANCGLTFRHTIAKESSIESRIFKRIEYAAENGKILETKKDIARVLKLNPRHIGANYYAGYYSFASGDYKKAEKFLKRVVSDKDFGPNARKLLAEMRMNKVKKKFNQELQKLLDGEAYKQALDMCKEALSQMNDNTEVMIYAVYASTMLGLNKQANDYLNQFSQIDTNKEMAAELTAFVEAWFNAGYEPELSLEKLLQLTDPRLKTAAVKQKMKNLMVSLNLSDKYEEFINKEKQLPGADVNSLERELINFLISNQQYEKALALINKRPVDSIEDNLIYVKLLIATQKEKKAMLTARHLMAASGNDIRLYSAWTAAYIAFTKRTSAKPEGADEGGKDFNEMAEEVLGKVKFERVVKTNPEFLLNLNLLAVIIEDDKIAKQINDAATGILFGDELITPLLEACNMLIDKQKSPLAANLLESAQNQQPQNADIQIKLAEVYFMNENYKTALAILERLIAERPEVVRAFVLYIDCLNASGNFAKAEKEILRKLDEPNLNPIVERQLNAKLEVIRMQNPDMNSK